MFKSISKNIKMLLSLIGVLIFFNLVLGDINVPAFVKSADAQACTLPIVPQNVLVEFPGCVGTVCNFTQAKCSWGAVTGALRYQLTITEVETGTVIKNEQPSATTTNVIFSVNQNKTYKCDVSAINTCGTGAAGTHSLYCRVDVPVTTLAPTPTSAPLSIPSPTRVISVPRPTIPPTGNMSTFIVLVIVGISFVFLSLGTLIFI